MKNLDFEIPEILQYVYTTHIEILTNEISKRVNIQQQQQQIELNGIMHNALSIIQIRCKLCRLHI